MQKSCDVLLFVMRNCMENSVVVKTWMTESYQVSQSLADTVRARCLAEACLLYAFKLLQYFLNASDSCADVGRYRLHCTMLSYV